MHSATRIFRTAPIALAAVLGLIFGMPAATSTHQPSGKTPKKPAAAGAQDAILYAGRPDAMQLATEIAARRNLPAEWVRITMGQARFLPQVPRLMAPPAKGTVRNWTAYRSRFIEPVRIRAGVEFWQAHRRELERAEQKYGVPAEIIVGIIGVETVYGRQMGNFRVLDALATLALDFPGTHPRAQARTEYFRGELEQVLVMAHRTGTDPFSLRGSYAGAMGMGQFMPTSWEQWAVDFDGDGRIDLFHSASDAIGSVANYFVAHGWRSGLPTVFAVDMQARGADLAELLAPDINPSFTAQQMAAKGVRVLGAAGYARPLALIRLDNGSNGEPRYIAGTENFYAVTRYNWSAFYALSVIELGQEVHAAYRARAPLAAASN